jgi:hypothetical protein
LQAAAGIVLARSLPIHLITNAGAEDEIGRIRPGYHRKIFNLPGRLGSFAGDYFRDKELQAFYESAESS